MEAVMSSGNLFHTTLIITLLITSSPLVAAAAGGGAGTLRAPTANETNVGIKAVMDNAVEPLQALVKAGVDVARLKTKDVTSALLLAVNWNSYAALQLLLGYGASVHDVNRYGKTALHKAAYCGHGSFVKLLLDHGARVDAASANGLTALHHAAGCVLHSDAVDVLIKAGAALDICDADGNTALMIAADYRNIPAIEKLLTAGANPFVVNTQGDTMTTILANNGMPTDEIKKLFADAASQRRKFAVAAWHVRWCTPHNLAATAGGTEASAAPIGGAGIPPASID